MSIATSSEHYPLKSKFDRASLILKGLIVVLLDMDTAKASIATPKAKRKFDRKDIDYLLHFLKYGYKCKLFGVA
jgi:hypothetical protein